MMLYGARICGIVIPFITVVGETEIGDIGRDSTINVDFSNIVMNFTPSRGREVSNLLKAGAAQNQPSGRALPSLIMGTWHNADDHVRAASHINPFAELINTSLSQDVKTTLLSCASRPNEIIKRRTDALTHFRKLPMDLEPARERWRERLPVLSPARLINFPLIFSIATKFNYEDTEFVRDLSMGMPIAGPVPATPGLTNRKRERKCLTRNGRGESRKEIPR